MSYSELKYVKTEYLPGQFSTCIVGKKNGYNVTIPIVDKNSDYIKVMQLVDAGELTIASTNGKYIWFEDLPEKDET